MGKVDLDKAKERGVRTTGAVYIQQQPQVRTGKKDDYMVGRFKNELQELDFKIWEPHIFQTVLDNGTGVYEAELVGAEFNNQIYVTVLRIEVERDPSIKQYDFLPKVDPEVNKKLFLDAKERLTNLGVSDTCWNLIDKMTSNDIIGNRFWIEGAATNHHDNLIGGLAHHSSKMLRILTVLIENEDYLRKHAELLTIGTFLHDIGKVFEYDNLEMSDYWYSNHRARGIEYLAEFKDDIIEAYDERFYRQLQSIIIGHHGDFGDKPTTVACAIVHYVDLIESQVTDLVQRESKSSDKRIYDNNWGYLAGLEY